MAGIVMRRARAAWYGGLAVMLGLASAGQAQDLSDLFGPRVTAHAPFPAPLLTGDFTGADPATAVYVVTILPASAQNRIAPDVTVLATLFGGKPLGARGEALALAIVQGTSHQKFLLTDFRGDGVPGYFDDANLWHAPAAPVSVAKLGSPALRDFRRQERKIKHDVLVFGTEAGIDMALYWNGRSYVLFAPNEEP